MNRLFAEVYNTFEGSTAMMDYSDRHSITSQAVLTVTDDETASLIVDRLEPRIAGKTVVEIGGGIGLLSLHMAAYAKHVFCIEANPVWSWLFLNTLLEKKPKNVSYLFGAAEEFAGLIKADIAIVCTHSGLDSMMTAGRLFAPEVIDFYGDLISENPDAFDAFARHARKFA